VKKKEYSVEGEMSQNNLKLKRVQGIIEGSEEGKHGTDGVKKSK